jgi:hypothetical protein
MSHAETTNKDKKPTTEEARDESDAEDLGDEFSGNGFGSDIQHQAF